MQRVLSIQQQGLRSAMSNDFICQNCKKHTYIISTTKEGERLCPDCWAKKIDKLISKNE